MCPVYQMYNSFLTPNKGLKLPIRVIRSWALSIFVFSNFSVIEGLVSHACVTYTKT